MSIDAGILDNFLLQLPQKINPNVLSGAEKRRGASVAFEKESSSICKLYHAA